MNLSPSWVDRLVRHGFEAVHWSIIGTANATDVEILTWANDAQRRPNPNSGPFQ
jgi:predicted nuclease of predicted toxin-antitoxin system